ncbi:MAG: SipW-dependent-type signal peptide-containing protein [Dehalococcoidales bacterium]|nr:SipW-dependent-type signal peptide-containing protein [Dehalococcoidales bacterium]
MKRILMSLMTVALVSALIGGGVFAYFSDVETSTGNTFTAGTLDLNLDGGNTNVVKFTVSDVKPGDSGGGSWTVANVGSIAGYLDLESISVSEAIGTTTDPEEADEPTGVDTIQLGTYLMVHLFVDTNNNGSWDAGEADIFGTDAAPAAINTIAASYALDLSLAATGGTNYITLVWSVGTGTDNRIQGDSVTLDITFELQQRAAD